MSSVRCATHSKQVPESLQKDRETDTFIFFGLGTLENQRRQAEYGVKLASRDLPKADIHIHWLCLLTPICPLQKGFDVLGGYLSPVHIGYGKPGLAPNKQRLDMARAAVENSDWIMVDDWETTQPSYTRTLPVLQSMRKRLFSALGVEQVCALLAQATSLFSRAPSLSLHPNRK